MTRFAKTVTASLLALSAAIPSLAAAQDKVAPAVEKPLKLVIGYVRQSKDDKALQQFATDAQGAALLKDHWTKMSAEQRKEFTALFQQLFAKLAFPKIRENFEHLAAINYSNGKIAGAGAEADALVVIDHPVKKQELKLKFTLAKEGGGYKVADVNVLGDSMLEGIRKDQIEKIMAQNPSDPVNHLLGKMRERVQKLNGKQG